MIKNRHTGIALFSSDLRVNYVQKTLIKSIFKRLFYTPPDLSPRFTCKVNLLCRTQIFFETQKDKLAATEDYRVLHKIMFRRSLQRSGWRDYEWIL